MHHTKDEWYSTLEGRIVRVCDRIAYINHDIDDAVRGGIISPDDLPESVIRVLGNTKSKRINTLVTSVINNSKDNILMDDATNDAYEQLHSFLFEAVYRKPTAKSEETKVLGIVEGLFRYFMKNPEKMSEEYKFISEEEGVERAVTDYIAGMTDHFAVSSYSDIYVPKFWKL